MTRHIVQQSSDFGGSQLAQSAAAVKGLTDVVLVGFLAEARNQGFWLSYRLAVPAQPVAATLSDLEIPYKQVVL